MIQLRPYQERVLSDLWQWFAANPTGDPIIEASVGAGKSVMIAEFCRRALQAYFGTRIVMAVHVRELAEQNLVKLRQVWPQAPVGVYSAALGQRNALRDITFCTIQSVHTRAQAFGHVDLLLVDECHLISPDAQTMYRRFIAELRLRNPALRVIGWTGTAFRGSGVWLTAQGLFTAIASRITMSELLEAGYLAPLTVADAPRLIETDGVRVRQGDYVVADIEQTAASFGVVHSACAEIVRLAAGRRKIMVFCVTVRHAEMVLRELRRLGEKAAMVTGQTPKGERSAYIKQFRDGRVRCLVNVAVLTTGFDVPGVDCIALLRPTKSPVLYVQIAGRGMRTFEGKTDCLWLDFTPTTRDLGPVDLVKGRRPPKPMERSGAPDDAVRTAPCPVCDQPNGFTALACQHCGHEFPDMAAHAATADTARIIGAAAVRSQVTDIGYSRHSKAGSPPSLRVDYFEGLQRVAQEWVCLEHVGFAAGKARAWWRRRAGTPAPTTVAEALARLDELITPLAISTRITGKYTEITNYEFDRTAGEA